MSKWNEVDETSKGIPALSQILVSEGYKMVLQSVSHLSTQVPSVLSELSESLIALGQPCETEMEKKSRFDDISRLMGTRLRQLLDGLSRYDDPNEMFLNSNTQLLLNNYRNLFFDTQKKIFTSEVKSQIKQSLCKSHEFDQSCLVFKLISGPQLFERSKLSTLVEESMNAVVIPMVF